MKKYLIEALVAVSMASAAVPAFASGYGPAPFYRPQIGAPASQRGQSAQTVAAERAEMNAGMRESYGGSRAPAVESGGRATGLSGLDGLYGHH